MLNRMFACMVMVLATVLGASMAQDKEFPLSKGTPEQRLAASAVVVESHFVETGNGLALRSLHVDGMESLSMFDIEENVLIASFATYGKMDPPQGQDPVPTLTTSWCDKDGVTHTVTTPIVSTTEAGLQRALDTHNMLVNMQQRKHPPKPCPPPPPPPGP